MRHPRKSFTLVYRYVLAVLLLACGISPAQAVDPGPECAVAHVCLDKVQDGGFETDNFAYWHASGFPVIVGTGHTGSHSVQLGGFDNRVDEVSQDIACPYEADDFALHAFIYITSSDLRPGADSLQMSVTHKVWTTSTWFHNGNERNTWLSVMVSGNDVCTPGGTVTVRFRATTDSLLPTTFLVDDVSLQICCPDDAYEPNDTFGNARAVSPGTYGVWLCPDGDEDWFQFSAAAGQTIVADLTPAGAAQTDICLFRPDGTLAACSTNPSASTPEHILSVANQPGSWRLRVYDPGDGTSTVASQLKIQVYGQAYTPTPTRKPGTVKVLPIIMKQRVVSTPTPTPTSTVTPAVIFSDNFNSGTLSGWNANGGGWGIENGYLRGVLTTNNAWYIKNASSSNFTYEGDVNILNGNAVGLTFRSSANGTSSYDAILDVVDGVFKISKRPGYIVLAAYPWPVSRNRWYHVKVVANGNTIEGYLDGVKRLTATDNNFASGKFGVMLFSATGAYDNLEARALP